MNFFIGIVLLILSTYVGYFITKKFDNRVRFYQQFNNFNNVLKNEMLFSQKTIKKILLENNNNEYFYKKINNFFNKIGENLQCNFLDKEEVLYLDNYISSIGQGDVTSQIGYLEKVSNYLNDKCNSSLAEQKKYKSLYIKLGFLIGLMLLILFI